MASPYISPLTVVRDVETSILDGTVIECMWGKAKKMEKGWEGVETEQPGGSNKLQSMSTQANTGVVKNRLVNNVAERGEFRVALESGGDV